MRVPTRSRRRRLKKSSPARTGAFPSRRRVRVKAARKRRHRRRVYPARLVSASTVVRRPKHIRKPNRGGWIEKAHRWNRSKRCIRRLRLRRLRGR